MRCFCVLRRGEILDRSHANCYTKSADPKEMRAHHAPTAAPRFESGMRGLCFFRAKMLHAPILLPQSYIFFKNPLANFFRLVYNILYSRFVIKSGFPRSDRKELQEYG